MSQNNKNYTLGLDIGGTNIKAVLFDGKKVIADDSLATPKDSLKKMFTILNALIEPLRAKARATGKKIGGIGLSVAGPVDYEKQIIIKGPNIPILDDLKLGAELEKSLGLPVKMDNDGNCFLRAEMKLGAGQKYNNVYGLTLGTGIGTAWWLNHDIYRGAHDNAGELAHTIIDFSEPLELEKAYQKLTQSNPAQIAEEAYRGDELAKKTYKEIGRYLGIALANVVNSIDPEVFIIGGGVIESSDLFLSQIKKTMRKYIVSPEAKKIKLLKSKLGGQAGAIGAALLFP